MIAFNAIYIMWIREVKRFVRSKSRILAALAQPVLFLISLGYGLGPIYEKAEQGNFLEFIAPGVIGMTIIFPAIFNGAQVIWDRRFGFLKEAMVAPVSRLSIMLGRTLGGATIAVLQGILLMLVAIIGGFRPLSIIATVVAIFVMFLIAIVFSAIGISISSKMKDMHGFQLIGNFLIMPLFFLSGALFPLKHAPKVMLWIAYVDPMSYSVDALRYALIGISAFDPALDITILAIMGGGFLWLGSHFFSTVEM